MNWRDEGSYAFEPPLAREEWAWQFLRRSSIRHASVSSAVSAPWRRWAVLLLAVYAPRPPHGRAGFRLLDGAADGASMHELARVLQLGDPDAELDRAWRMTASGYSRILLVD